MPRHVATPAPPSSARRRGLAAVPSACEAVDPVPSETEERRQQRHRREHHDQDDDRDGYASGSHERYAGDCEAEDRDDDRPAGEHDGLTGRGNGPTDGLLNAQTLGEVLAVPGDQEQGVVDPHAEADHAGDHRCPARDVDEVGDQGHRADAEGEAEKGHPDRQAHRDDGTERQEQDDHGGDQTDHLTGARLCLLEREEQVSAELDLERGPCPRLAAELLEVLQVDWVELIENRVLDTDQCDPTVR